MGVTVFPGAHVTRLFPPRCQSQNELEKPPATWMRPVCPPPQRTQRAHRSQQRPATRSAGSSSLPRGSGACEGARWQPASSGPCSSCLFPQDFTPEKKAVVRAPRRGPLGGRKKKVEPVSFIPSLSWGISSWCQACPHGSVGPCGKGAGPQAGAPSSRRLSAHVLGAAPGAGAAGPPSGSENWVLERHSLEGSRVWCVRVRANVCMSKCGCVCLRMCVACH